MNTTTAVRTWAHQDDNRLGLWITEPRVSLAYVVSDLGASIIRLAGHIGDEPLTDLGQAMDDYYAAGHRVGFRAGQRAGRTENEVTR